jgi:O-antigen ligase
LDFVFGLLNRDTTLTGRLQSWSYLINSGISTHPLFGSGFGATWVSIQFRAVTQAAIGWDFAPLSADNGLVDIFLNLGLVGVILLISTVLLCLFRVVRHALKEQTIISFFPVLVMIFVITANISVSFILELESFAWFLMVFALFSTTPFPLVKQAEP